MQHTFNSADEAYQFAEQVRKSRGVVHDTVMSVDGVGDLNGENARSAVPGSGHTGIDPSRYHWTVIYEEAS